jgi:ACS family hexuronate transporter-like MFS transporter
MDKTMTTAHNHRALLNLLCRLPPFCRRFVDWIDTKKGFSGAIGVWSVGAILHAFCGIATSGITAGKWLVGFEEARKIIGTVDDIGLVTSVSVTLFIFARFVLALGEAGNFRLQSRPRRSFFRRKNALFPRAFSTPAPR